MKVVAVETVRVEEFPNLLWVQVHTDDGLVGLGETFYGARTVEAHVHETVAPYLIGKDPLRIEAHNRALHGYVGYSGSGAETRARSAVDIALWDLLGQATGQPIHVLLGGMTRPRVRTYNTCAGPAYVRAAEGQAVSNWGLAEGRYEDLHAQLHHPDALAEDLLASGITAMKIWPFDPYAEAHDGSLITPGELVTALEPIRRIRAAVGDAMDVMIEMHALWDVPTAIRIAHALEEYRPFWIEDPVRSDLADGLAAVAAATRTRVAAGETVAGLPAFQGLLADRAIGVATVDITWCGGLTEARKVAAAAAAHGVPVAPHDCTGPVALTACAHLSTAAPNALMQETVRAAYLGWYRDLVTELPAVADGHITSLTGPGLGTALLPDLKGRAGTLVTTSR
jgi:L-alanine-DL-glutamate epimerase-like enolase superfamily enzyme